MGTASNLKHSFWFQWRAVISAISLGLALGITIFSPPVVLEGSWLDLGFDFLAWSLFLIAIGIRLWSTMYIGGKKSHGVISQGPYSICRNPLYWGTFFICLSQSLFLHSFTFLLGIVAPVAIYMFRVVPAEEHHLLSKFPLEYGAYRDKVSAWWPSFAHFVSGSQVAVDMRGMGTELRRITSWVWLPFLMEAINLFREMTWWPHLFPSS